MALLNRLVSAYIDIAEINAMQRKPMYMKDWIEVLDGFITMSRQNVLTHAGKISAELAQKKALDEYDAYKQKNSMNFPRLGNSLSPASSRRMRN